MTSLEEIARSSTVNEIELDYSAPVESLEKEMLKLPQEECPVIHRFGPGIYMREVHLKKGMAVIGHHHNFEHMNIFLKGKLSMIGEDGQVKELIAPMVIAGKPGRKVAFTQEDCVWINVYSTTETNVEILEEMLLTKSDGFLEDKKLRESRLLSIGVADREDFKKALDEIGVTEEMARKISVNRYDITNLPRGSYKIKTGNSSIEGVGLFATSDISPGEIIAPARIDGKRTVAGRYTNHSASPNAKMIRSDGPDVEINLVATKPISGCKGGQDGEEITINYRDAFMLTSQIGDK